MAATADVVVVGGGVIGASTAFQLAALGAGRVVVCERRHLAAGATGKSGALVRMHYTNEPEARLAAASLPYFRRWSELVGAGDCGFLACGMLRFVARELEPKLRANVEMLERLGVNTSLVGPAELRELVPDWDVSDQAAAAYEPDSGCADPVGTTYGFLERACQLGAELRLHTEVTAVRSAGGRVVGVDTTGGPIDAPAVVVAGGAWALPLLRSVEIELPLQPVRVQVAIFRRPPSMAAVHPICIDGPNAMWLRPEGPGWASTLAGIAQRLPLDDPEALDEGVDADYVPLAQAALVRRIPALADSPMRGGWAGLITMSDDGKPVADRHPAIDGLYYFTADSGSSFKTAPALGRGLAEWVTAGQPRLVDLRPFRASRFAEGRPLVGEHEYGDRDYEAARQRGVMLG